VRQVTVSSPAKTQDFVTGWFFVAWMAGLFGVISIWISWDMYNDPYNTFSKDIKGLVLFNVGINLMVAIMGLACAFQRVSLDFTTGVISYANLSSFHRWRSFPATDVIRVVYSHWHKQRESMVSNLYMVINKPIEHREVSVTFLDSHMTSKNRSPFFSALVQFVQQHNPKVEYIES
jgi:hypothetical protein